MIWIILIIVGLIILAMVFSKKEVVPPGPTPNPPKPVPDPDPHYWKWPLIDDTTQRWTDYCDYMKRITTDTLVALEMRFYKWVSDWDLWNKPDHWALPDVVFSSDGSKMYIMGMDTDTVYQYTLSTPWDVSSAEYAAKLKDVSGQEAYCEGVAFNSDGFKMYTVGTTNDRVYQYTLSTAWDVSTATFADKIKDVGNQDGLPINITFSSDGSKMYISGYVTDTVYQYILPVVEVNIIFFSTPF